jgi:PAS domain S-box-containing protein
MEVRLTELLDSFPDPVLLVHRRSCEILDVSNRRSPLFGHAPDTLVGRPLQVILPAASEGLLHSKLWGRHDPHPEAPLRLDAAWDDGTRSPVEVQMSNTEHAPHGVIVAIRALSGSTEQAERELIVATCASPYAIVTWSLNGRITAFNPAAARVYGLRPEDAIGQSIDLLIPHRERRRFHQTLDRLLHGECVPTCEGRRLQRRGASPHLVPRQVLVEESLVIVRDPAGRVNRFGSFSRLVTRASPREREPESTEARLSLADVERAHIQRVLTLAIGNRTKASRILGVTRTTLRRKLAAYGLEGAGSS